LKRHMSSVAYYAKYKGRYNKWVTLYT
jgi:hypothetical protein